MPKSTDTPDPSPRFFKGTLGRFIIRENLDNQHWQLNLMAKTLERFIERHLIDLRQTDDVLGMLTKRHELDHLWGSFRKEDGHLEGDLTTKQALSEYETSIKVVQSLVLPLLAHPECTIPKTLYTNLIEHHTILQVKKILSDYLALYADLNDTNQLKLDLQEIFIGLGEIETISVRFYTAINQIIPTPTSGLLNEGGKRDALEKIIADYQQSMDTLSQHMKATAKESLLEKQAHIANWHTRQLKTIQDTLKGYLYYMETPDKSTTAFFVGVPRLDENTRHKLRCYPGSQNVRDRKSVLNKLSTYLKQEETLSPLLFRTIDKVISQLIDYEVENSDEVLGTEKEHFKGLYRCYISMKERFEANHESDIKHILSNYINYIEDTQHPKRLLTELFKYDDDPDKLKHYPHWQIVKDRLAILKQLQRDLPRGEEFSALTIKTLHIALHNLKTNKVDDPLYVLPTEKKHYDALTDAVQTLKVIYKDHVFEDTKSLVEDYFNYLDYHTDPKRKEDDTNFLSFGDQRAQLLKGYSHWQVVKDRKMIINQLIQALSYHEETTHSIISSINQTIWDLEGKAIDDYEHVSEQEQLFFSRLKSSVTQLKRKLKSKGQKDIQEILSHYLHFIAASLDEKTPPTSFLSTVDTKQLKLLENYPHWQLVQNRHDILKDLDFQLFQQKLISTSEMKGLLENTLKQLKEEGVDDETHVLSQEKQYVEALKEAFHKLEHPPSDYPLFPSYIPPTKWGLTF